MNRTEILEYIKQHLLVSLCTINEEGYPETRVMMNLHNKEVAPHLVGILEEKGKIYVMANTKSEKISQIIEEPLSSLYFYNDQENEGLLLLGETTIIKSKKTKEEFWSDEWEVYYEGGLTSDNFGILEFTPNRYKLYKNWSVKKGRVNK